MKHEQMNIVNRQSDVVIKTDYDVIDGDIMKKHSMILAKLESIRCKIQEQQWKN